MRIFELNPRLLKGADQEGGLFDLLDDVRDSDKYTLRERIHLKHYIGRRYGEKNPDLAKYLKRMVDIANADTSERNIRMRSTREIETLLKTEKNKKIWEKFDNWGGALGLVPGPQQPFLAPLVFALGIHAQGRTEEAKKELERRYKLEKTEK